MKKTISFATSFLLGFAFFVAGGALASETTTPSLEGIAVEETVNTPDVQEVVGEVAVEETQPVNATMEASVADVPYCFNVGKSSESSGDCTCVQDLVTTMEEVDCLIASGVVPASSYEAYRKLVLGE